MRFSLHVFSLFCLMLSLAACQMNPQPMGRGYSSFTEPYKSAKGVDARGVGYEFNVEDNETIIADMRFAAQDLVMKLDREISFSIDQIYLQIPQKGVFYRSFDYVLRDELTKHGYRLALDGTDALPVVLVAHEVRGEAAPEGMYRNIYLGLAIDVVGDVAGSIFGDVYEVPAHDFKPTKVLKLRVADDAICAEKAEKCAKDKKCCGGEVCEKGKCDDKSKCAKCDKCSKKCSKDGKCGDGAVCEKEKKCAKSAGADEAHAQPLELKGGAGE